MAEKPRWTVFDMNLYGVMLRTWRQKAGYNRAENFCDDVKTWTGVKINKEALYRIEKGMQPPTVEQLIAFSIVLFHGKGVENALNKSGFYQCLTPYADYLAQSEGDIRDMPTYDGMRYEFDEDGNVSNLTSIYPDEEAAGLIDEYYYDELFHRQDGER